MNMNYRTNKELMDFKSGETPNMESFKYKQFLVVIYRKNSCTMNELGQAEDNFWEFKNRHWDNLFSMTRNCLF
jgi:hypothetical protein